MTQVSLVSLAGKLQASGFSSLGARQLFAGELLSDGKDRRRLALLLAGLFEVNAIRASGSDGRSAVQTQSGIVIEFPDEAVQSKGPSANKSSSSRGTVTTKRTRSGVVMSFEDEA